MGANVEARPETTASGPQTLRLSRSRTTSFGGASAALALLLVALAWIAFCWTVKPGSGAAHGAATALRLMSLIAIPVIFWAARLGKDAAAADKLLIDADTATIENSRVLRQPLKPAPHRRRRCLDRFERYSQRLRAAPVPGRRLAGLHLLVGEGLGSAAAKQGAGGPKYRDRVQRSACSFPRHGDGPASMNSRRCDHWIAESSHLVCCCPQRTLVTHATPSSLGKTLKRYEPH